ncbi:MAG TPA: 1-(5-phosphoribosyl)-5-[(5-phosphoribosylamino)methylideneamino]imidazole-4-carboxamide isomerase [Firmicutes bacterium]|nr:1-(5-phosphoribosyl)-5-[(5-phosphoribosylamino)methylideneamino]imidazole-4-carboxamide isomerase [Bacillota bacterium]
MIILPAIDILDQKCVRLTKGDYNTAKKVAQDPIETAKEFESAGAEFIHMVDLNGARDGRIVNNEIYEKVVKSVNIPIEVGGGIRNIEIVDYYISKGINRVIIGSAALTDPEFVKAAVDKYGDRIAVGIDAENGMVKTSGWLENSNVNYIDLALKMQDVGVKYLIFTDISKDGTLSGPNFAQLKELSGSVSINIIASGGIHDINDIIMLKSMNLYGAICGKSIYSGSIDLREAIRISK